jgi:acetyltransferase-like isoleucine patch superfamily enzyme
MTRHPFDPKRELKIHPTAHIGPYVRIGDWSVVGPRAIIEGDVEIGRAAWISSDVIIGGGQKELGSLRAGDFLHVGVRGFINIADEVKIGHEVGLGVETKLYTHGGYLSVIDGFPFQRGPIIIGNNVWLPNAMVLPNVKIGSNVVVAAMSLVNKDLPDGCLAGGVPAKVIEADKYPDAPNVSQLYKVENTVFNCIARTIRGAVTPKTEDLRNRLRRQGIRFRYYDKGGEYAPWD